MTIYRFARAAGIPVDALSTEEADEIDTLLFRKNTDMPFGPDDQLRIDELAAKARHGSARLVILESPYAGEVEANVTYARACLHDSLRRGEAPIASHLLYTQDGVLDDAVPHERDWGIAAGLAWRKVAQAAVFYTDRGWSGGMLAARDLYRKDGIPFEVRSLGRDHQWGCVTQADQQGEAA